MNFAITCWLNFYVQMQLSYLPLEVFVLKYSSPDVCAKMQHSARQLPTLKPNRSA